MVSGRTHKEYRQDNLERCRQWQKDWIEKNKKHYTKWLKEYRQQYHTENKEKKIQQAKQWIEANRERNNENRRKNYWKKKNLNNIYSNDSTSSKCETRISEKTDIF